MSKIPSEKELNSTVKLVELKVEGTYIARLDERRRTTKKYSVMVLLPEGYGASDVKRLTARTLYEHPDLADFMSMRTHMAVGKPKKTTKTAILRDTYSDRDLAWFSRKHAVDGDEEQYAPQQGIVDSTEYGDDGLPAVVNE